MTFVPDDFFPFLAEEDCGFATGGFMLLFCTFLVSLSDDAGAKSGATFVLIRHESMSAIALLLRSD